MTERRQMVAVVGAGVLAALGLVSLSSLAPAFSRAGSALGLTLLAVVAGGSLIGAGLLVSSLRATSPRAVPLALTGFAWFATEAANPGSAPALAFTLGLVAANAWPALLAHAALGGLTSVSPRWRTLVLISAYVANVGLLGVIPTLAYDPPLTRCAVCPENLIGLADDESLRATAMRVGFLAQAAWIVATVALLAVASAAALRPERRARVGAALPTVVGLAAVAANGVLSIPRGFLSNDRVDLAFWMVEAVALVGVSGEIVRRWVRRRRARHRVARVALDFAATPAIGELTGALREVLGDPTLEVLYPLDGGGLVDAQGAPRPPLAGEDGRTATKVTHGERLVAVLEHREGIDDPARLADALEAASLALENERLHAQSRARLRELKESRTGIVAAAESERRRLERDLHDGSQQRLLALAIDLAVARRHASEPETSAEIETLETDVRTALGELRELAHGIMPRSLVEDGLAAALEELVERSPVPIDLVELPDRRVDAAVEGVAYLVAAWTIRDPAVVGAVVAARFRDRRLEVEVTLEAETTPPDSVIVDLADRCGALDGSISVGQGQDGGIIVKADIPCGS